jgi:hypothetical protein
VEALTDTVRLWALALGARMIDVLDGEVKLIFLVPCTRVYEGDVKG